MRVYDTTIEIYLDDLKEEAQEEYLKFFDITREEMNCDVVPIMILEKEPFFI